jgi:hypothetical protein
LTGKVYDIDFSMSTNQAPAVAVNRHEAPFHGLIEEEKTQLADRTGR